MPEVVGGLEPVTVREVLGLVVVVVVPSRGLVHEVVEVEDAVGRLVLEHELEAERHRLDPRPALGERPASDVVVGHPDVEDGLGHRQQTRAEADLHVGAGRARAARRRGFGLGSQRRRIRELGGQGRRCGEERAYEGDTADHGDLHRSQDTLPLCLPSLDDHTWGCCSSSSRRVATARVRRSPR